MSSSLSKTFHSNNDSDNEDEEQHYMEVISCLKAYSRSSNRLISKYISDFECLSQEHQQLIPTYRQRLDIISKCLPCNQSFLDDICQLHPMDIPENSKIPIVLQENLKSLFRQLVRDWSSLGKTERESSYGLLMDSVKKLFPNPQGIRVLVPGAGLGRLVYDLSALGFDVQGNEFSLLMLFTSELILNHSRKEKWQIFPFLFPFSNQRSCIDQCRAIAVPDADILCPSGNMSMTAGDFLEVYEKGEEVGAWDCVVTCFFLDTAPNILQYLETIRKVLKPGGMWLNLGPLLYHFEGNDSSVSIELTLEELISAIAKVGFEVQSSSIQSCSYVQNPRSMLKTTFECSFMIMQKK